MDEIYVEYITDVVYTHAKSVCNDFEIKKKYINTMISMFNMY